MDNIADLNGNIIMSEVVKGRMFILINNVHDEYCQFIYAKVSDGTIISGETFPYYARADYDNDTDILEIETALTKQNAYTYYAKRVYNYKKQAV